ncbi:MAG: hypothetical protein U1E55_14685 [Paracoccus sp. (in: a-proteobacteria)]
MSDATPRRCRISLDRRAWNIRRKALLMGEVRDEYIGQALGVADVLAVSYFHALNHRPHDPEWEGRDRFLLSIGHYAIALYAALMEARILPEGLKPGMDDSRAHVGRSRIYAPGMEITGGINHGLGIGVGMALGLRQKGSKAFVYNLMSDGELGEGSTWEAAGDCRASRSGQSVCIVDFNDQQADEPSTKMLCSNR